MLTIQSASNPKYTSENGNFINLNVKFAEVNEIVPFGASPTDPMPYGVELYNRAKAGEFGIVAPYVAPPQPTK
jgi:hypothetical protein